jgi:hypothetical protein
MIIIQEEIKKLDKEERVYSTDTVLIEWTTMSEVEGIVYTLRAVQIGPRYRILLAIPTSQHIMLTTRIHLLPHVRQTLTH